MDVQGWVVIGLALLMFGYLVPHLVMTRQQLAEARVEDRFSTALRVVVTGTAAREASPTEHHGASGSRPYLHDPRRRTEGSAVKRPTTAGERAATEARRLAAARAARAAEISRRQAAARRRLVLTVLLLLATAGGWVAFGVAGMSIALGIAPTLLLAAVLVAGRRAAKIAARRNAADRAAMTRLELQPASRTRPGADATAARLPDQAGARSPDTEDSTTAAGTDETVSDTASSAACESEAGTEPVPAETGDGTDERAADWTPVPVPAPTYTLKASASRRDVAPYTPPEPKAADAPATTARAETPQLTGLAGSPYGPVAATEAETRAEPAGAAEPERAAGLDLHSVLARRRALGA